MSAEPLLRVCHLVKTGAAGVPLLDIADLSIPAGACILLSGRNGAGKTTLLKVLAGLETPDRARLHYRGESMNWDSARSRFRHDVIYLHQQPYLFDTSVAANVAYGLRGNGRSRKEIARLVAQALAAAGLSHLAERNARDLSGGERQRVAITRALVLAPRLLLLDEPLASLDEESRARTCGLLHELKSRRIAVVLTSHERLSLVTLTDYHYELSAGRLTLLSRAAPDPGRTVVALDGRKRRRTHAADVSGKLVQ